MCLCRIALLEKVVQITLSLLSKKYLLELKVRTVTTKVMPQPSSFKPLFFGSLCDISKTSAGASSGYPDTEKQMKARGRRRHAFIASCFLLCFVCEAGASRFGEPKR